MKSLGKCVTVVHTKSNMHDKAYTGYQVLESYIVNTVVLKILVCVMAANWMNCGYYLRLSKIHLSVDFEP